MSHFFYDSKDQIIDNVLEGIIRTSPHANLTRLKADTGLRVVIRNDWDKQQVALISGGGSGHEPMHAGFVGKGMLTAAVCGDIFASPGVDAVLSAIINVTGDAGCLLIVKNYTGDRLNFGLAAEKARALGYKVEMVLAGDDISLPDNPQPRGLSGTILAHKVAGYAASQGLSLTEVTEQTRAVLNKTATLGVALSSCHLPASDEEDRVPAGKSELGMGIHGEHGVATLDTQNSREIVQQLTQRLLSHLGDSSDLLLMINNLGGFSALELAILSQELLSSPLGKRVSYLQGPATLVSALDMKGVSLTVLPLTPQLLAALQAPVEVSGWSPVYTPSQMHWHQAAPLPENSPVTPSKNAQTAAILVSACQALIDNEQQLNRLDSHVGDGDTGSTLATGARFVVKAVQDKQLPLNDPAALLRWLGESITTPMGGSGGVLLSLLFSAAAEGYAEQQHIGKALLAGLEQMKKYGGAKTGDRTMVDALQPALEALAANADWDQVVAAAEKGAAATAEMKKAGAGRSAYLNADSLQGHIDPGARAVSEVFSAIRRH
ncbi:MULTISPECIES: dihydroxyacetone kinase subunit DhaK [unclassified Tatumella]|uniref:dihydroxyacetone kinase subunit DhaK n=1 Tax=unclassified Tatumella TaxID=2649542 RepID=UPI001BAFCE9F|nr:MULTISPECIES: dihydroxyacetone kinase subunit DhaK [unclassified Tatumella]MBS0856000.1 dihydroxyacetone kinase subunit DhaK [Tatumella sp. JGM16]MBS0912979.1 dihydroxyacetone kinase subunit DhaK [Tatumella sp. JGM91]